MTDKEKYTALMQRYWEAETTPEEEWELAQYAARVDDPEFDLVRGILGYLSIGREKRARRARNIRVYSFSAAAACIVSVVAIGLWLQSRPSQREDELCVSYAYGVQNTDNETIMASVESSLADFFAGRSPAETNLLEMFQR